MSHGNRLLDDDMFYKIFKFREGLIPPIILLGGKQNKQRSNAPPIDITATTKNFYVFRKILR